MKQIVRILLSSLKYFAVSALLISISGCSSDKREDGLSYVLKQIYQGPDLTLVELSDEMMEEIEIAAKDEVEYTLESSEFFTSLEKRYENYVTVGCYEKIISQRIPYKHHLSMAEMGYVMNIVDIEINKNVKSPNIYDFIVKITLSPKKDENIDLKVKGSAQFENDGNRITFLRLLED
ncbi:MAG: hypothetical protein K0R46_2385, partial [Herbinix sp.]|nr:hypothetical protein [Herbinix sp.]